jgi:hypothetical protein
VDQVRAGTRWYRNWADIWSAIALNNLGQWEYDARMTEHSPPAAGSPDAHVQQMGASLETMNARIARLAIALGISLQDKSDLARVMNAPAAPQVPEERRRSAGDGLHAGPGPDRRIAHSFEELRGLIVLRYKMEKSYVDDVGVAQTRKIFSDAEDELVRRGFRRGEDGTETS